MNTHISDLLHDFVTDNEAWEALLVCAENVSDKRVKSINEKLLHCRELTKVEDPFVAEQTLRMKGITLTDELIQLRGDSVFKSLHVLPSFSTLHGSPDYPKFIEFLLGRSVKVSRLYTVDYVNFYPEPEGLLVHEGGNWYQTSHVELEVEDLGGIEEKLGIDAEMFVQELFYRYAPIEEVIHRTYDLVRIIGRFYLASRVELMDKHYVTVMPEVADTKLWIFPKLMSGEEYEVRVLTTYMDEAQVSEIPKEIHLDVDHTYENGKLVVDALEQKHVSVWTTHKGVKCHATIEVYPFGFVPSPDDVYVVSDNENLYGAGVANFTLMGVYGDFRQAVPDQMSVAWSHDNKEDCVMQVNTLQLKHDVRIKTNDTVRASYVCPNGKELSDAMHIHVHPTNNGRYPVKLEIQVLDEIFQGERENVGVFLRYSDRSVEPVNAFITSEADAVTVHPNKTITSEVAYADYNTVLHASYKEDGYNFEVSKEILLKYRVYEMTGVDIFGGDVINEDSKAVYRMRATWEGGVQAFVDADWRVLRSTQTEDGTLTGARATVSNDGILSVPEVVGDSVVILQATLRDEKGQIRTATKVIQVKNTVRELTRLDLETDRKSINQGERTYVYVYGSWTDGTTTLEDFDKYQIYVSCGEDTYVKVGEDPNGVYIEYVEGIPDTVKVYGRINYADKEITTQPWYVSLVVPTIKLESVQANRLEYIEEATREMFGAQASWEDGRVEDVTAVWTLLQEDKEEDYYDFDYIQGNFSLRDLSYILTSETLTAEEIMKHPKLMKYKEFKDVREVDLDNIILNRIIVTARWLEESDQDAVLTIKCKYYKEEDVQYVTLTRRMQTAVNPILSASIQGPLEFESDRSFASYSLLVKYDNSCEAYNVSNDWSVDCPPDIAEIDENGFLYPRQNIDQWITVTATIDCGGRFLERSLRVHMKTYDSRLDALNIFGASEIQDNTRHSYYAELVRNEDPTDQLDPGLIQFSIETLAECHLDPLSGELHVGELLEDHKAILTASYEEYDYGKRIQYDSISTKKEIRIIAQRKLTGLEIQIPDSISDASGEYQLQAKATRANGEEAIINAITAPKANIVWRTTKNVAGVELLESGLLKIGRLAASTQIPVECVVYEGQNVVRDNAVILITSESTPTVLEIVGQETIRHLGQYEYRAIVTRVNGHQDDVTSQVFWKMAPEEKYISFHGGKLSLDRAYELKDITLTAILQEGEARLETVLPVEVRSTYPLYGAATFGINTPEEAFNLLKEKIPSNIGGNMSLFVAEDEYAYVFYPRDFGKAKFLPIGENLVLGWDGANRNFEDDTDTGPKEIEVITEEGEREIWYLYRTNNKGFDYASFAVSFETTQ